MNPEYFHRRRRMLEAVGRVAESGGHGLAFLSVIGAAIGCAFPLLAISESLGR